MAAAWLVAVLPLTSFATTLMMGRLLWLERSLPAAMPARTLAVATLAALAAPMIYAEYQLPNLAETAMSMDGIAHTLPPVAAGLAAIALAWIYARRGGRMPMTVPEGDIAAIRGIRTKPKFRISSVLALRPWNVAAGWGALIQAESRLRNPHVTGAAFFLVWLTLLLLLVVFS